MSYTWDGEWKPMLYSFATASGKQASETTAQTLSAVWGCVNAIAGKIGSMRVNVYEEASDGGKTFLKTHRLQHTLNIRPNAYMSRNTFFERAMYHLLLWGDHFAIPKKTNGVVTALELVHPDYVTIKDTSAGIRYYEIKYDSFFQILSSEEIIHVPGLGSGDRGKSIITQAAEDIGWALASREFGASYFRSGGKVAAILQNEGNSNPTADQVEDLKKAWDDSYGGSGGGKIAIIPRGLSYHPISQPPEDAQFIGTHKHQLEVICRWFNVDPEIIQQNSENSNYAQYSAVWEAFSKKTLQPHTEKIESEYSYKLFDENMFMEFDYGTLLKADPKTRAEINQKKIFSGVLTPNEARIEDGKNPYNEGNDFYMQAAQVPVRILDDFWASKSGQNQVQPANENG